MITRKQKEFLQNLIDMYGQEPLPSYENISKDLGLKSKNSVWQYVQKLIDQGLIQQRRNRFFLSQDLFGVPLFDQPVKAGFPSPAEDCLSEKISFDKMLISKPASTFTVKISGDSMIDAGIYEDDIAVVEQGKVPRNGDTVLACVDGEYTVKFFKKTGDKIVLEPANPNYPVIIAQEELSIIGVVTGIVRQF